MRREFQAARRKHIHTHILTHESIWNRLGVSKEIIEILQYKQSRVLRRARFQRQQPGTSVWSVCLHTYLQHDDKTCDIQESTQLSVKRALPTTYAPLSVWVIPKIGYIPHSSQNGKELCENRSAMLTNKSNIVTASSRGNLNANNCSSRWITKRWCVRGFIVGAIVYHAETAETAEATETAEKCKYKNSHFRWGLWWNWVH